VSGADYTMRLEMHHGYSVLHKRYDPTDTRLGRHVRHDSRSLEYLAPSSTRRTLVSVRHESRIPTLDQGQLGSCTGNAATKCLSYAPLWSDLAAQSLGADEATDEAFAVKVYSAATALDDYAGQYPPTDTGSDGLSVAKVLTAAGLISGYRHATSLAAVVTALQTQPVIVGTEWRADMFDPDSSGRLRVTGAVEGGHEYVLDEVDIANQRLWMQNSWGDGWGDTGRAWFTFADFAALLKADGDCTVFTPSTQAPPTPAPPTPTDPTDLFVQQAHAWLALRHTSKPNALFVQQVTAYLDALGRAPE